MNQPNLFTFATSELSQDAFICWLLSWAKPEFQGELLNQCAVTLLKELFNKHGKTHPDELTSVTVLKQNNQIDVLCVINNRYAIIIEDKIATHHHSGQLERYIKEVQNRKGSDGAEAHFAREDILPIYLKTRDQASFSAIEKKGYKPFLREDFLQVLEFGCGLGIDNAIFIDFYRHLSSIEEHVQSYLTVPVADWGYSHLRWEGFFVALQKELDVQGWGYVPNPQGGFMGFWMKPNGVENCNIYLQLENEKLCVKLGVFDGYTPKVVRTEWYNALRNKLSFNGTDLVKPTRFGHGGYMTILCTTTDYRQIKSDGCIDMDATITSLRVLQSQLKACVGQVAEKLVES